MLKYLSFVLFFSVVMSTQLFAFHSSHGSRSSRSSHGSHSSHSSHSSHENKNKKKKLQLSELHKSANKPHSNNFVVMTGRDTGMFHVLGRVCNLIKCYEEGDCRGIEVDFGTEGLYYEASRGNNWWSYYFKPLRIGKKVNVKTVSMVHAVFLKKGSALRKEMFNMIQKYFHVRPHIQNKVNRFTKQNFKKKFVISVHYRGTDKVAEAPLVPYEKVPEEVLKVMNEYGNKSYKIFVATDEQAFLDYMIIIFGDLVCYNKDALRSTSGKPVHLDKNFSRYKCGEDALIDCILLSKGNFLIRSSSNLSYWSSYFNPDIPVVRLNTHYSFQKIIT